MASLLTIAEARALISTGLSDVQLQSVIDREEAWMIRALGPHYAEGLQVTAQLAGRRLRSLYLPRPIATVTSITVFSTVLGITSDEGVLLDSVQYRIWGSEGRIERLPYGSVWGEEMVVVVYGPQDDNALRKSALIDLLRFTLSRSGLKSESVAGEYSYTAFESTDGERAGVMRKLGFINV